MIATFCGQVQCIPRLRLDEPAQSEIHKHYDVFPHALSGALWWIKCWEMGKNTIFIYKEEPE